MSLWHLLRMQPIGNKGEGNRGIPWHSGRIARHNASFRGGGGLAATADNFLQAPSLFFVV